MNIYNTMRFKKRFKNDIEYDPLVPPHGLDFFSMKPKQAKENFDWFISNIPTRTEYLINRCSEDLGISVKELDFSPDSLKIIWKWFLRTARFEKTPEDEVAKMEEEFGHFGESWITREQLTETTEYIIRDIAMYISEIFLRKYNGIAWSYYTKPKKAMYVNQPLLTGFFDTFDDEPDEPFEAEFAPIHMVGVQAANLYDNTQKEKDLYDVFKIWEEMIPAE